MNLEGFGRAVLEGKLQAWPHRHPLCLQKWILTESTTVVLLLAARVLWRHCQQRRGQASGPGRSVAAVSAASRTAAASVPLAQGLRWAVAGAQALAAPSLAVLPWLLCRRAFPSAQSLMTQHDTGWQEPWWVYRGTVSPDMGTVCLL